MKVADVKLTWTKSPSSGIVKEQIVITINGTETTTDLGPNVEEFMVEVKANGAVQFKILTFDDEGLQVTSEVYSFTLSDLESPLPAVGLFHEIVSVREET